MRTARRQDPAVRGGRPVVRFVFLCAALLAMSTAGAPAWAQSSKPGEAKPSTPVPEALEDVGRKLTDMLDLLIQSIPQYEMPEIQPNGDILIRRKPKDPAAKTPPGQSRT